MVQHASETVNVVDTCVSTELLRTMLPHLLEQLEVTQKSLSAYLGAWVGWARRAEESGSHGRRDAAPPCIRPSIAPPPPPPPPPHSPAETKRSEFPRFYFVSDPTLLEILSLGSDPPSVVPHFQSGLFDSLSNVTFDKVRHMAAGRRVGRRSRRRRGDGCAAACSLLPGGATP